MNWIKRAFFAVIDFFKKPAVQDILADIVQTIIQEKFGGKITPQEGLKVYGQALDKLETRLGKKTAQEYAYNVAEQIDTYAGGGVLTALKTNDWIKSKTGQG